MLQSKTIDANGSSTNITIELYEDFNPLLGAQFWTFPLAFWIGVIICAMIVLSTSYIKVCIYVRREHFERKKIRSTQDDILPYLNPCTKYLSEINQIIFEYANVSSNIDDSRITTSIRELFFTHLFVGLLLMASYVQIYMVIAHWNDSYLSYLKSECEMVNMDYIGTGCGRRSCVQFYETHTMVYMDKFIESCPNVGNRNETNFIFEVSSVYRSLSIDQMKRKRDCYIHRETMNVRQLPTDCCCGNCGCCTRCGKGCKCKGCSQDCCCCADCANACGYFWCITLGLGELYSWCFIFFTWKQLFDPSFTRNDGDWKYEIQLENGVENDDDKEYLL